MSESQSMSRQSSSKSASSSYMRSLKPSKSERELEEGETISPSPSPQRRSSRRERSRSRHRSSRRRSSSESRHRSSRSSRHYRSRSRSRSPSRRKSSKRKSRSPDRRRRRSPPRRRRDDEDTSKSRQRSSSRDRRDTEPVIKPPVIKQEPLKKERLSATAPNSDTPEQYKLFTVMFGKLARANKKRGDSQKDMTFGMIDHFHALCDYMLNFYYMDMSTTASSHQTKMSLKEASGAWKTLFPFADTLLNRLKSLELYNLYGLCARLVSLVRYYIFDRMVNASRSTLSNLTADFQMDQAQESHHLCELSAGLMKEYEKAVKWFAISEEHFSYTMFIADFPETYKEVCLNGDVSAGISLGGEAGTSVEPMFPLCAYSPLHHAAIVSKCILNEYITKQKLDYTPIQKPEEFMD